MKKYIHRFIKWYLIKCCGGAFHTGEYNSPNGFYIFLCTDDFYGYLQRLQVADMENRIKWSK